MAEKKLEWAFKKYHNLTIGELYDLLKLRVDIFVVEQACPYPELDGKDNLALHQMGFLGEELVAYSRIFPPGSLYPGSVSLGRIAIKDTQRGKKWGKLLMEEGLSHIRQLYGDVNIKIAAQSYLKHFYEGHGFKVSSEEYDWDGIPHIDMEIK